MPSFLYPLEGNRYREIRFNLYDKVGREIWGEARVVREFEGHGSPDVLSLEVRQVKTRKPGTFYDWKPILKLAAHDAQLLAATFGIHGGDNDGRDNRTPVQAPTSIQREGSPDKLGNDSVIRPAEVRKDEPDPNAG